MRRLLTLTEGRVRRAWLAMVAHLREENSVAQIADRIRMGHYDHVAGLDVAIGKFTAEEHAAYIAAGQRSARWINGEFHKSGQPVAKKLAAFDPADPISVRWARENSLSKLRELTDDQRGAIREILTAGARSGDNPLVMAREIRDSIGLTKQQAAIVENYRRQLESRQFGAALQRELSDGRFDRTVTAAMRDARGLTAAQIDTMVERYRQNWVAFRAENIARTEGLRVAHQGTEELYRQAIANGDIDRSQIERTWNHSPGKGRGKKGKGGPRSFHVSMHGQKRGYGEPFVSGLGAELRFPGDPEASAEETANCACALSTRLLAATGSRSMPQMPALADDAIDVGDAAAEDIAAAEDAVAAEEEAAALEAEFADVETVEDPYATYEVEQGPPVDPLPEFPASPGPPGWQEQQLQQQQQLARQRLAEREAAHAAARAQMEATAADLEAAQREVDGFRIAVGAIGDETGIAEGVPEPVVVPDVAVTAPAELHGDPYRTPPPSSDVPTPSDKPAPLGYESWNYKGDTYYRHALRENAPYYTQSQVSAITRGDPLIGDEQILRGPNEQFPGFDAVVRDGKASYMPKETADGVYHVYTRDQVLSGEAAADEKFLAEYAARAARKPSLLARVRGLFGPD